MDARDRQTGAESPKSMVLEQAPRLQINGASALMDAVEDVLFGSVSVLLSPIASSLRIVQRLTLCKIAGIAGKFIEYPFDTVKVRLQSQPDTNPLRYAGPLDCFRQSWRQEGVAGLYRGISAPLVGAALENSSLFVSEQAAQKLLFASGLYSSDAPLPLSALFCTGGVAGAVTSLVLTPVELVKCKMQVPTGPDGLITKHATVSSIIRNVFRHQGLMGFWHGQMGTLIRETGGCAAWFGSKETVSMLFRKYNEKKRDTADPHVHGAVHPPLPLWQQAVAGASAGMSYNFLFFPADTVKSRMQTAAVDGSKKQASFWAEGRALWKQAGLKGMYRGCGITVFRSAPASAFIFIIYDGLKRELHFS
jgi:ornithine carrier protein